MVYVFLADGFEEIEAIAPIDILRRAKIEVKTVGVTGKSVCGSHGIILESDITVDKVNSITCNDMIVLPGGMPGTLNLEKSQNMINIIKSAHQNDSWICAICAAPSILGHLGYLNGYHAVCYPGYENELNCLQLSDAVCIDKKIITAKGAGVAVDFGLNLVSALLSQNAAQQIKASIQCK